MASSSSGPLSPNAVYQLGQYQFKLNVTKSQEGDSKQIQAQMTENDQSKYHSIYVDGDATVESWRVEANESTADVYVTVAQRNTKVREVDLADVNQIPYSYGPSIDAYWPDIAVYADFPAIVSFSGLDAQTSSPITLTYYAEKDLYCGNIDLNGSSSTPDYGPITLDYRNILPQGHASEATKTEELLARFAIETQQAVDPTQPEQWDEQPDTGDPQYRLGLTVWGALSGRHNDPLHNPSFSYVPADQDSVKGYGGGGDGGHGGGGGGGASTVIVYEFGTDKAGSKNIKAFARRHGYGSSGGRGGRGGDGCIIVYY